VAVFGPGALGGCADCTGHIALDPASFVDVSDPAVDPDNCDPGVLDNAGVNFGEAMTASVEDGGGADFQQLGLIDAATMQALGVSADLNGNQTAAQITSDLAGGGYHLAQAAGMHAIGTTVSGQSGLDAVANPMSDGSEWLYFWYIYRDPATNPHEGADMVGDYYAGGFWQFGGN
jgi:hypothetical protein